MLVPAPGYLIRPAASDEEDLEALRIIGHCLYSYPLDELQLSRTRDDLADKFYLRCAKRPGETTLLMHKDLDHGGYEIVGATRITPDPAGDIDPETEDLINWSITCIMPGHRGKGLSTPLREFALANTRASIIKSRVAKDNEASWRVAEKTGYTFEKLDGKDKVYVLRITKQRKAAAEQVLTKTARDFNSAMTAISRKEPSAPTVLLGMNPDAFGGKRVLHAGAGREGNPDRALLERLAKEVVHYDPHHGPSDRELLRKGDFDAVYSPYVLNVLDPDDRAEAIKDLYESVRPGGEVYIAARADVRGGEGWKPHKDGFITPRGTFQRNYDLDALEQELRKHAPLTIEAIKGGGHYVLARGRRGEENSQGWRKAAADTSKQREPGKKMPQAVYVHRRYAGIPEDRVPESARDYTVAKKGTDGTVTLIGVRDFDTADEPLAEWGVRLPDGQRRSINQVYHHKWQMVGDDYDGFDLAAAKRRSELINQHVPKEEKSRMGRPEVWNQIVERLGDKLTQTKTAAVRVPIHRLMRDDIVDSITDRMWKSMGDRWQAGKPVLDQGAAPVPYWMADKLQAGGIDLSALRRYMQDKMPQMESTGFLGSGAESAAFRLPDDNVFKLTHGYVPDQPRSFDLPILDRGNIDLGQDFPIRYTIEPMARQVVDPIGFEKIIADAYRQNLRPWDMWARGQPRYDQTGLYDNQLKLVDRGAITERADMPTFPRAALNDPDLDLSSLQYGNMAPIPDVFGPGTRDRLMGMRQRMSQRGRWLPPKTADFDYPRTLDPSIDAGRVDTQPQEDDAMFDFADPPLRREQDIRSEGDHDKPTEPETAKDKTKARQVLSRKATEGRGKAKQAMDDILNELIENEEEQYPVLTEKQHEKGLDVDADEPEGDEQDQVSDDGPNAYQQNLLHAGDMDRDPTPQSTLESHEKAAGDAFQAYMRKMGAKDCGDLIRKLRRRRNGDDKYQMPPHGTNPGKPDESGPTKEAAELLSHDGFETVLDASRRAIGRQLAHELLRGSAQLRTPQAAVW